MAKLTIQFEVIKTTEVDEGWDVVDVSMPRYGGPANDICTTANGPAADDGNRTLKRLLGMYVVKRQTGLSQARLNEYVLAVKTEERAVREADRAYAATHTRQPRQRTRKRSVRDFVAVVCKLMLYIDAKERFGRMLNWAKVFKTTSNRRHIGTTR